MRIDMVRLDYISSSRLGTGALGLVAWLLFACRCHVGCAAGNDTTASYAALPPLPAFRALLETRRPYRIKFEVQQDERKTGTATEMVNGGANVRIRRYSEIFEATVQGESFVARSEPAFVTVPERPGATNLTTMRVEEAGGFVAESNLCWTAKVGYSVQYAPGPPQEPTNGLVSLDGNFVAARVALIRSWISSSIRLAVPDLFDLVLRSDSSGTAMLGSGVARHITYDLTSGRVTQIKMHDIQGQLERVIHLSDFRQWEFGESPSVAACYRVVADGRRLFERRFFLRTFEWLPAPILPSGFLPGPGLFEPSKGPNTPRRVFVNTYRSNRWYALEGTNLAPVYSKVDLERFTNRGRRRIAVGALLITALVPPVFFVWRAYRHRKNASK